MRLRRALGEECIETGRSAYLLRADPDDVDVLLFRRLIAESRSMPHENARGALRRALSLWRGEPLVGIPSDSLQRDEVPALTEERVAAQERRISLDLRAEPEADLVAELLELTKKFPLRETSWSLLITALVGRGRHAEALAAYNGARDRLRGELGVDPSGELQRAFRSLLAGNAGPVEDAGEPRESSARDDVKAVARDSGPESGSGEPAAPEPAPVDPAAAVVRPRQLPLTTVYLVGRETDSERVVELLASEGTGRVVVVSGPGGVGKSALALHVAHRLAASFPDGQLYADLRDADPRVVLSGFLRGLGVAAERIPERLTECAALYRSLTAGLRLLVVLDNSANERQVRPLLPAGTGCATVVTSCARLAGLQGAGLVELRPFDEETSLKLLSNLVGVERVEAESSSARALVRGCDRLPLALCIVGAKLAARPHRRLATLAARLADERRRLTELRYGDLDIMPVLMNGYQLLREEARSVLSRLAAAGLSSFSSTTGADLLGVSVIEAEDLLESLVDAHMLKVDEGDQAGEPRYRVEDLTRIFFTERAVAGRDPGDRHLVVADPPDVPPSADNVRRMTKFMTMGIHAGSAARPETLGIQVSRSAASQSVRAEPPVA
jgi:DNA-binding SARP family transcriptional activator